LRRLVFHTIFGTKRDGPLFAVNFVRDESIVVKGRRHFYTGTAVFRFGLKNGNDTTVAVVFIRCASIVNSICSLVPRFEYSVPTLASAISFFSSGENAVVVALPTCLSPA